MPHLSICIPTYCQIDFLRRTLLSVQAQDFNDYELIISDDTPDDTVSQLVASFDFDGRLRYHRNPVPLGSPENWNEAVRRANGDYIKLLHHDDRLDHPGALSAFVRLLDEHPEANFAFGASLVENITSGKNRIHRPTEEQLAKLSATPEKLFFGNAIGAPSATIYRNGLGIEYDRSMKWLVDIDFYIRTLLQNPCFVYTPEVLVVTTTNAVHQVTETCKNNAAIDLLEHTLLYQKIAPKLLSELDTQYVWFRLFEKYRAYSQKDFERLGVKLPSPDSFLAPFFSAYRREWLKRVPYRVYACTPEPLKRVIKFLLNLRNSMSLKKLIKKPEQLSRFAQYFLYWTQNFGLDIPKLLAIRRFPRVVRDFFILKKQNNDNASGWKIKFTMPSLYDIYEGSGVSSGHYFHQDLFVAQRIFQRQPAKHVDIGSRVETFVAHVATFRHVEVLDIRPLVSKTPNITFRQCDSMQLPDDLAEYCDSVSCLHALEHFGLGRYGDTIDINGHLRGFESLYKILKPHGILYLSFPVGTERIEFNAHRVFSIRTPLEWAKGRFDLIGFSYVDDKGDLHTDKTIDAAAISNNFHLHYGCGIFEFQKN